MIYKKPNVRYTDMAIWVDEHAYKDDCDENLMFEYIFHLINMLAHQANYFKSAQYYDDFAVVSASKVFMRYKNPKQFKYDENGEPLLRPVKSVLNYIKSTLYAMKVAFEQENYCQTKTYNKRTGQVGDDISTSDFQFYLTETVDKLNTLDFNLYLHDVAKTTREFISKIPQKKGSAEWRNIYLSVLLSFLNSITLNNKNKELIREMGSIIIEKPQILNKMYKEERSTGIILFHLDESYRDYVTVLVNRVKHLIASDLSSEALTYVPSDMSAKSLLLSSMENERITNNNED